MSDLVLSNVSKRFGDKVVLEDFSAVFPAGKITCIMGPSGCGKTTLLTLLMGFLTPDSGRIAGVPQKIGAVFQEDRLCEDFSPVSNLRMVLGRGDPRAQAEALLGELGLRDSLALPVRELSGGMKRRVAIARALLYDADLLLLDEAFKGLDGDTKQQTMDCLLRHIAGKTVLAVTHDAWEAQYLGGAVLKLEPARPR